VNGDIRAEFGNGKILSPNRRGKQDEDEAEDKVEESGYK
jgi:hypothetical protein